MSEKKVMLTFDGLKNLEAELQNLKTERRKDVAEKIKDARSQGDLSENAEYDAAKEEQAEIEARIVVLEKMLRNAEVIDEEDLSKEVVNVGNKVVVLDKEFKEKVEYTIVARQRQTRRMARYRTSLRLARHFWGVLKAML